MASDSIVETCPIAREEQTVKAWMCARCWTRFPKDADFCPVCGAPRREMSLVSIGSMVVVVMAVIGLFIADGVSNSTSMLLGFLPWLILGLGCGVTALQGFTTQKAGALKYVNLFLAVVDRPPEIVPLTELE
jgi:hypothetical protein